VSRARAGAARAAAGLVAVGAVGGALAMRVHDLQVARDVLQRDPVERRAELLDFALSRRLDLSDAQRRRMRRIVDAQREDVEAMYDAQAGARAALRAELLARAPDVLDEGQLAELRAMTDRANAREGISPP